MSDTTDKERKNNVSGGLPAGVAERLTQAKAMAAAGQPETALRICRELLSEYPGDGKVKTAVTELMGPVESAFRAALDVQRERVDQRRQARSRRNWLALTLGLAAVLVIAGIIVMCRKESPDPNVPPITYPAQETTDIY